MPTGDSYAVPNNDPQPYVFHFISTFILGATCKHLHQLIHQDELLWSFKVSKTVKLLLWSGDDVVDKNDEPPASRDDAQQQEEQDLEGLIYDPTLHGHKELFLLYSTEFKNVLRSHRRDGNGSGGGGDLLDRLIRSLAPRLLLQQLPPSRLFLDPDFVSRVALFGPGIESPNTKHLVHRMVNAHTSLFDALSFVSGLPGGFGSGVRIDFRKIYKFDLMCLYTNSESVRESQRGVRRLLAAHNRLLASDVDVDVSGTSSATDLLHNSVLKLLPTLHAIIFAVDGTELCDDDDSGKEQMKFLRSELGIMTDALSESSKHMPILVLSCTSNTGSAAVAPASRRISLTRLADHLGLTRRSSRPWAVFSVNIADMEGMAKALDWLLFHVQKRRNSLEYHQFQSGKLH